MTKRRTYTKELKIEAVELADEIGNSAQAERDLGIPYSQIYKWRKKFNEEGGPEKAFPPWKGQRARRQDEGPEAASRSP
jgi:transposase-like protein